MTFSPGLPTRPTLGIIGAGRLGQTLARLALAAGYRVLIAGSGAPVRTRRVVDMFAPGAEVHWAADVAERSDVIVLCIPLGAYDEIEPDDVVGRIVVDAMNYWPEADGVRTDLEDPARTTSRIVAAHLPNARVVKAFNHVGFRDLFTHAARRGSERRIAIGLAGDDGDAVAAVSRVITDLGFDAVAIGGLDDSRVLEPTGAAFGAVLTADALRERVREG